MGKKQNKTPHTPPTKNKNHFNNMKITSDRLVCCVHKGSHLPSSWFIPVLENLNFLSTLHSSFLSSHTTNKFPTAPFWPKLQPFSSHITFLNLLIIPEVLPCLTSATNSWSLSPLQLLIRVRQGNHSDSTSDKQGELSVHLL